MQTDGWPLRQGGGWDERLDHRRTGWARGETAVANHL